MSEQEMIISLVCHGNLKALRQTKNLNHCHFERDIWHWLGLTIAC